MKHIWIILFVLVFNAAFAAAEEHDDIEVFGLELEKLLNFGSGLLALALSIITFTSFKRTKNKRLAYVAVAFLLFAVKGFFMSAELIFGEWPWVDLTVSTLDFAILLSFFLGLLRK